MVALLHRRIAYAVAAIVFVTVVFLSRDVATEHVKNLNWNTSTDFLRKGSENKENNKPKAPEPYDIQNPYNDLMATGNIPETPNQNKIDPQASNIDNSINSIKNATFGFEHIFVVGLPARSDRRDGMALGASLTGVKVEFIDGIAGSDIAEKAITLPKEGKAIEGGSLGAWRAHINAIQDCDAKLTTALIMEDDIDWDVRIKRQLRDFALSSRALLQPLRDSEGYADPSYPYQTAKSPKKTVNLKFSELPPTKDPITTPYGDGWDAFWLGNCGMNFPDEKNAFISRGRVASENDETVPAKKFLENANIPQLLEQYPDHTRVVHHSQGGICSLAYAVTQRGAQKMLYELALKPVTRPFDLMLHAFCGGDLGGEDHNCLAISPPIFNHHRPAGNMNSESDISPHGENYRDQSMTDLVRWSVRVNAAELLRGKQNFVDAYPDPSDKE